jgi:hypothetical protein
MKVCVGVCVCVCLCVCQREKERERQTDRDRDRDRENTEYTEMRIHAFLRQVNYFAWKHESADETDTRRKL